MQVITQLTTINAHSSAIRGIACCGNHIFTTGLDQRVSCWELTVTDETERLRLLGSCTVEVLEPSDVCVQPAGSSHCDSSRSSNICLENSSRRFHVSVAGRGVQLLVVDVLAGNVEASESTSTVASERDINAAVAELNASHGSETVHQCLPNPLQQRQQQQQPSPPSPKKCTAREGSVACAETGNSPPVLYNVKNPDPMKFTSTFASWVNQFLKSRSAGLRNWASKDVLVACGAITIGLVLCRHYAK